MPACKAITRQLDIPSACFRPRDDVKITNERKKRHLCCCRASASRAAWRNARRLYAQYATRYMSDDEGGAAKAAATLRLRLTLTMCGARAHFRGEPRRMMKSVDISASAARCARMAMPTGDGRLGQARSQPARGPNIEAEARDIATMPTTKCLQCFP